MWKEHGVTSQEELEAMEKGIEASKAKLRDGAELNKILEALGKTEELRNQAEEDEQVKI